MSKVKKQKEMKIKQVKVKPAKKDLNEAIFIDFIADQINDSKQKLDEETEKALYDLKKKTINEIFRIEKLALYNHEKHKMIEDFVKIKMINNEFLKSKLDNSILKSHGKLAETARSLVTRTKSTLDKVTVQGWLEYYWSWDMKAYKLLPLYTVNFVHFMDDSKEIFLLDTPCKLYKGKPVYIVLRGVPFCIPMDFRIVDLAENLKGMEEINKRFVFNRTTLTSYDLYAKFQSLIVFRIFTPPKLTWKNVGLHLLSAGGGALAMWSILSPYLFMGS